MKHFILAATFSVLCDSVASGQWRTQTIDTKSDLRGLCVVSPDVAWASGTGARTRGPTTAARPGRSEACPERKSSTSAPSRRSGKRPPTCSAARPRRRLPHLQNDRRRHVLGRCSSCADPAAFFDAIAFWDEKNGIALGDPVKGQFQLLVTADGGASWKPLPAKTLPPALPGEGAFAASGTCLVTHGEKYVWFATGGAKSARAFRSRDRGLTWEVSETPVAAGAESAGIFSIAFRDKDHGVVVGGDYRKPNDVGATAATTSDGGKTWALIDKRLPFRSAVAWAKDRWVAVGTSGSHASLDGGATWTPLDREKYNSVGFTPTGEGWAVGPKGRIASFAK
ncbi:MAG: glycosyl hydrolase [Gemmataceae bacterium]